MPSINDKIIAKSSKFWMKIHKMECKALKTVSFDNLLEAHREHQDNNEYKFLLKIKLINKYMWILDVMSIFSELNFPISELKSKNYEDGNSVLTIESIILNPAKIWFILKDLKKYLSSIDILKKSIE
jgi:(p)ppGpp synthase/HD superfamily hydrolase